MNANYISTTGYIAAFCTTISFLPQAIKTIRTKDTSGISLPMYSLFTFGSLCWFLYGVFAPSMQVAVANAVTTLFALVILIYKIRYK